MPTSSEILKGLQEIANQYRVLAIVWHVYFGILAVGLLSGVRPSRRLWAALLALPLLSVSAIAWSRGNPFNGTLLAVVGVGSFVAAGGSPCVRCFRSRTAIPGLVLFLFGWVYPHFLETPGFLPYLYSAPTGLVPCPTLSIVIGLALMMGGAGSRAWVFIVGGGGIFYGLFGALKLGVTIDWILFAGAILLVSTAFSSVSTAQEEVS